MISRFSVFLCLMFIVSFFAAGITESAGADQREGQVFSNKDLEAYKGPTDNQVAGPKSEKREKKNDGLRKIQEELEKEQWCKKATVQRRKIEKAQDEVTESEDKLSVEKEAGLQKDIKKKKATDRKLKRLQQDLDRDKKRLRYAEKDLADLEAEAHRKGVLPGWLRCQ